MHNCAFKLHKYVLHKIISVILYKYFFKTLLVETMLETMYIKLYMLKPCMLNFISFENFVGIITWNSQWRSYINNIRTHTL